ncbi:ketopantoate reductase family protein [Thermodesulforhabdus norvegica]|uniref:2-dehydropantoate 2-reductase n=1 Tax=Thermodesulforhabdus norvegica TaxID=39841 RepID=A0A1I4W2I0_9BACT|nr:2-dehydropantoate 2-reductase [Thermodesulforhabdus norvegica]SFN07610.1 2-dehydropantoate 2-reductase [Thermodesulforhabdus norvegica]
MKIGVMGTGGVGGYFGVFLAMAGHDIHFVARGKHLQAIEDEGLRLISNEQTYRVNVHATSEPHEIGPVDLLLFCVKSYDTEGAARLIEPMVESETTILTLQNGIDNVDKLARLYDIRQLMAGTAYIESTVTSPGVIVHKGPPGRIVFGELDGSITERARTIEKTFQDAQIDVRLTDRIQQVLWEKFLFICGVHGVGTISRSSIGQVLACPETRKLLVGVMREVEEVARKRDISLPDDIVDRSMQLAESYDPRFRPSMLRDLEWRRPIEIEALNGLVVKMGKEVGVETPLNFAIYAALKLEHKKIVDPYWAAVVEKTM